jgi:molecular chaperone HscB
MNLNQNHFQLFGLPREFAVDAAILDARYRELQREVHPDRFATASDAERRLSMQMATQVNEAYRTLKAPLPRARYLLELDGVDVAAETNTAMPADFLVEQMEWREGLEEAGRMADACGLVRMDIELKRDMDAAYATLAGHFGRGETAAAAVLVRKLMFLDRLHEEIADARDNVNPLGVVVSSNAGKG